MVLSFPEQQAALCKNTRGHQPTSSCSEWSAPRYCPWPFTILIMIIDIDKGIFPSSKLVSFADDTRVYSCINDIEKCDRLQIDRNSVYDWGHVNNISHVNVGRVGTLSYNSFRWRSIRLFNRLPLHLRSIFSCSVLRFKTQLDIFLGSVEDLPFPGFNNSRNGGDCRWWSPP